jgi:hypothetical protein
MAETKDEAIKRLANQAIASFLSNRPKDMDDAAVIITNIIGESIVGGYDAGYRAGHSDGYDDGVDYAFRRLNAEKERAAKAFPKMNPEDAVRNAGLGKND